MESARALTLSLTNRCNRACEHCLVDAGPRAQEPHAPERALLRLIDEFAALGGRALELTGGEPLLHPAWGTLLARALAHPSLERVALQTNGALLGDRAVGLLRGLDAGRLEVRVSLDGATAATHDRVRGQGSFERTLAGLRRLCGAGLGRCTTVAFTEMSHNLGDLPALLELAQELGLGRVECGSLVADGRAGSGPVAPPSPADVRLLLQRFAESARFRELYASLGRCAILEWWKGRDGAGEGCCTLGEHPYVTHDGRIYPCALCRDDDWSAAGAHDRPLGELLADAAPRWATLAERKRRRHGRLPDCQGCAGLSHCGGGCPGRAHAAFGTFDAVEDRCALRKVVYLWPARWQAAVGGATEHPSTR